LYNKFRPAQHKHKKVIPQLTYAQVAQTNVSTPPARNVSDTTPEQMLFNIQQELKNIKAMVYKLEQNILHVSNIIRNNSTVNTPTSSTQPLTNIAQPKDKQLEIQHPSDNTQSDRNSSTNQDNSSQAFDTLTTQVKTIMQHLQHNTERTDAFGEYLSHISNMSIPPSAARQTFQEFLGQQQL
jgi:hypothetical protein